MGDERDRFPRPEDVGGGAFSRYWDDWLHVSRHAVQRNATLWTGIWQRMLAGATPDRYLEDAVRAGVEITSTAAGLAAFPLRWLAGEGRHVPALLFIVDPAAEATAPASAVTPISAGGLAVGSTELQQIGGTARIAAAHVCVRLLAGGDRVEVWLADLGGTHEERARRGILPGQYTGVVYADEPPVRRPMAMVHVVIESEVG